jgi:hypothetical protein
MKVKQLAAAHEQIADITTQIKQLERTALSPADISLQWISCLTLLQDALASITVSSGDGSTESILLFVPALLQEWSTITTHPTVSTSSKAPQPRTLTQLTTESISTLHSGIQLILGQSNRLSKRMTHIQQSLDSLSASHEDTTRKSRLQHRTELAQAISDVVKVETECKLLTMKHDKLQAKLTQVQSALERSQTQERNATNYAEHMSVKVQSLSALVEDLQSTKNEYESVESPQTVSMATQTVRPKCRSKGTQVLAKSTSTSMQTDSTTDLAVATCERSTDSASMTTAVAQSTNSDKPYGTLAPQTASIGIQAVEDDWNDSERTFVSAKYEKALTALRAQLTAEQTKVRQLQMHNELLRAESKQRAAEVHAVKAEKLSEFMANSLQSTQSQDANAFNPLAIFAQFHQNGASDMNFQGIPFGVAGGNAVTVGAPTSGTPPDRQNKRRRKSAGTRSKRSTSSGKRRKCDS